ncbi:hypothetical protein A2395_01490 [Candidatus Amesbacteria bacterium RIFOXYB1_FULL_47_9]|uniref:Uncharacterized protein n=1 Tax=Candidatus Amesbacteria bacterium RIFOXYB1_FULL_47_9 TaxID=1797266 RepID=A0A1F4ZZ43_9BACT|nr:MAG: hypothetical protein A2395_01490 [Candidatus Amesbacteria bacterium RIFOXYB1_FULL_47_9]
MRVRLPTTAEISGGEKGGNAEDTIETGSRVRLYGGMTFTTVFRGPDIPVLKPEKETGIL